MSYRSSYHELKSRLEFEEKLVIKKDFLNGSFIIRGTIKKRDVLLKIVPKGDFRVLAFKKEERVDQTIAKHNKDLEKPHIYTARVIASGSDENLFWLARRYYPGNSLAQMRPGTLMIGYNTIRRKFLLNRKKIIDLMVDNLESFQTITKDLRKISLSKDELSSWVDVDISTRDVTKAQKDLGFSLGKQVKFYEDIYKIYCKKGSSVASVQDLSPANIIVANDGKIIFSDFEHFAFDNYTFDIAYLWLFLYRYRKWQNYLIKKTINTDLEKNFFRASIIRILINKYIFPAVTSGMPEGRKRNSLMQNHPWTKYLGAAGESFESILKV